MIGVILSVPIACYRKGLAREYLETYDYPPPSTCYGFLLSLVGEVDRNVHRGARVTIARCNQPERSVILRTKWRIKDSKLEPGVGCNRTPDYQQLLTDCRLVIWLDSTEEDHRPAGVLPLEERVRLALDRSTCGQIERFGGLSLGESTHLVNDISLLDPQKFSANGTVGEFSDDVSDSNEAFRAEIFLAVDVANMEKNVNLLTLPVWVDHVGSSGTRYVIGQFKSYTAVPLMVEMPKIVPPPTVP